MRMEGGGVLNKSSFKCIKKKVIYFNDMWMFSTVKNSSARANVIKFQSIRRPGTVAKSFVDQDTAQKKLLLWGHRRRQKFCDFLKEKKSVQPPRKLRLGHLKFILIRKRPNMGPPFSTNNTNRLRRLGLILILTITICGATWEGGPAVVLWCICVFVSLCLCKGTWEEGLEVVL